MYYILYTTVRELTAGLESSQEPTNQVRYFLLLFVCVLGTGWYSGTYFVVCDGEFGGGCVYVYIDGHVRIHIDRYIGTQIDLDVCR